MPSPTQLEAFDLAVQALTSPVHIVISQVDPDAIATAVALQELLALRRSDLSVKIGYAGAIGHPQTRILVNRFNLRARMSPLHELEGPAQHVLVDSSLINDSRLPPGLQLDPCIVVDHHRSTDIEASEHCFLWIEDVGAASTLAVELYEALSLPLDETVATLLALGIYTDTKALMSAGSRDRQAWVRAADQADYPAMSGLIDYPLPDSWFRNLSRALKRVDQQGSKVIVGLGSIDPEAGDDLSTVADLFLRRDGVSLVVVWGIIGDEVRVSARNSNLSQPLDDFLKQRFGASSGAKLTPDGRGEGGARLRLDFGVWMSESTMPHVEAMVSARIREAIFEPEASEDADES